MQRPYVMAIWGRRFLEAVIMAVAVALAAVYVGPILAIILGVLVVLWLVLVWFMEWSSRGAKFRAARHEAAMRPLRDAAASEVQKAEARSQADGFGIQKGRRRGL